MEGTHIFLLLVWCLLANVPLGVTGDGPETIENSTAVLECGIQEQHTYRYWYTGQFNKTTPPPGGDKGKLFEQFQNNQPVSKTKRSDMSADSGSFALTIGSVMLDDDGYFTCSSKYGNDDTIYKSQRIHVYIPAEIQFDGPDDGTSFNATDTAEVTCTINRLYPPLTDLSQFKIKWDDNVVNTSKDISSDDDKNSAKMYEVSLNRTLCPGDNKKHLVCEVKPDRGPAYMVDRTYTVQCPLPPIGSHSSCPTGCIIGSVIGSVAGVVIVLAVIVICIKKKRPSAGKSNGKYPKTGSPTYRPANDPETPMPLT